MSEYEKLRLQNIQERNKKFQEKFGTCTFDSFGNTNLKSAKRKMSGSTLANLEAEKSDDEDEFVANVSRPDTRKLPKRSCTTKNYKPLENSDSEFEMYVDNLVESTIANNHANQDSESAVTQILDSLICSIIKPEPMKYKRKFFVGRKSKIAMKFSRYRKTKETQIQYEARLKQSSNLKSKMKTLDNGVHHERKLEVLKGKR